MQSIDNRSKSKKQNFLIIRIICVFLSFQVNCVMKIAIRHIQSYILKYRKFSGDNEEKSH